MSHYTFQKNYQKSNVRKKIYKKILLEKCNIIIDGNVEDDSIAVRLNWHCNKNCKTFLEKF